MAASLATQAQKRAGSLTYVTPGQATSVRASP